MIKSILFLFFLQVVMNGSAQDAPLNDGPYVFYRNDKMSVESIVNGELKKESFDISERITTILQVPIPGHSGKFFSVPIKPLIEEEPSEYKSANKILALSDIEGTFEGFKNLLIQGGVTDGNLKWSFGAGHLVINGDVFDRGEEVTACLWLIYKLEEEAKENGGYVHLIMGNHEIMNLSEDIRYVHPKYLQSAKMMERTYMEFYLPNTELGMWLRSKNIIEKIGKSLFVHGGISNEVNEEAISIKKINSRVRPLYDRDGLDSILKKQKATTFFHSNTSPFWYRGYFAEPKASMDQVERTLQLFNVNRIIVGHTIMDSIKTFFKGKVVAIDVNHHKGDHQALLIEKDQLFVIDISGKKSRIE